MKGYRAVAVGILCIPLALFFGWKFFESWWFLRIVPANIGVSYPITISGITGFREGCGIAVFRIDSSTARKISADGISFFTRSMHSSKSADPYHTFSPWQRTPDARFAGDDQTILSPGVVCAEIDLELQQQLEAASRRPGSYYSYGQEKVLLVMPQQRLVVLSYNG